MHSPWQTLLNPKRFRTHSTGTILYDERNEFENDYTRIILSPHFRRLQNKTQVFPYDDTDFVRNRLTHSLEVSSFARSLGLSLEKYLIDKEHLPQDYKGQIPSLLATAGLTHDLGNPPFGHFGEECIQSFFIEYFKLILNHNLTPEESADFTNFEGNAQTFRILRKLGPAPDRYSYNLTFPVLSCIIKYPYSSLEGNIPESEKVSQKKFGFFQSEKSDFEEISSTLNLGNKRHPLVFLLEAADDIAYSVSDIEDGCKKGIITKDRLFAEIEKSSDPAFAKGQKDFIEKTEKLVPKDHPSHFILVVQRYRIISHSVMLQAASECFVQNHEAILSGDFDREIMYSSKASELRKLFKRLGKINFQHSSVLKREIAGYAALKFHLETFSDILNSPEIKNPKSKEHKFYNLISANYRYILDNFELYPNEHYKKLLLLTDFISGMTDTYALKLYHELSGISPY